MPTLTETNHAGEFILSADGESFRDVTVLSGQDLGAGAVAGKVLRAQAAAPIPAIDGTGTGLMSALTFGPDVQVGSYVITLLATSATAAFSVVAPDGTVLPNGAVGTAYTSDHVNFLISDGGTMTADDAYTIVVTAAGTPVVIGGTGTGTMSAISLGPDAQNGGYQVVCRAVVTNGGDFEVIAPDGTSIGRFLMGTGSTESASFASRHINFTLTDATDFIVDNYFNIIVARPSSYGKVVEWDPTTYDGRHKVAGLLYGDVDASDADTAGVLVARDAEVKSALLVYGSSITTAQKAAALEQIDALGISVR